MTAAVQFQVCAGPRSAIRLRPVMRTTIDIDDDLMAEARKASGLATRKQTVEQALRLMVKLRRQRDVAAAFGRYPWRGDLTRSRVRARRRMP